MNWHLIASSRPAFKAGVLYLALCACASAADRGPLTIKAQGSLVAGGTVLAQPGTFDPYQPTKPDGQTYHGDHVYAFYQVPVNARALPIVMWHGAGQSAKTWETTADGREGFQNIFLRRRFSTYLIDQPRRGDAGRSTVESTIKPVPDEQLWFNQFRIGLWPKAFEGSQFPRGPAALEQFFRAMTPNTGPY
ncbi:MAG: alpha/beta hydrolase, partial [Lysobacter sp.]|nr:alpha/beta hydrolase [Lysobacter sp.]